MAMLDNGGLSPLGYNMPKNQPVNQMVVTDKRILLVPVDRPHWIFRGRIESKKVRPIRGDLR